MYNTSCPSHVNTLLYYVLLYVQFQIKIQFLFLFKSCVKEEKQNIVMNVIEMNGTYWWSTRFQINKGRCTQMKINVCANGLPN